MGLQVDHPWVLLLLVPVAAFVWLAVRGTMRLTGIRKLAAITVRGLILLLLVAVASGVTPYQRVEVRNVVFAADRSASVAEDEAMAAWIRAAIDTKEERDRAAVVSFGLNAVVDRALSEDETGAFALRTEVNRSFSHIDGGLQLAAGLLPEGGRIVLLSDGEENVGDLTRQGRRLQELGIAVDVVDIPRRAKTDAALDVLRLPAALKFGEKYTMEWSVTSTFSGPAELRLFEDDAEIARMLVELETGENRFAVQGVASEPGFHRYRAEIYADGDEVAQNNTAYAFSRVDGPPRVLVVEGAADSSGNIVSALEASYIPYDVILPEQLSTELASYARYDSIVLNNVPATRIAEAPMRNLDAAVADYGIGLVAVGGRDSYGLGGYFKTPLEKALPVYMDLKGKREMPSLGLILVIDKSGSMDGGKLELAKEAALRTVELLRDQDTVGVVAFDSSPWWVVEPVQLGDRDAVMQAIQGIQPSGGTEIYTAVEMAYRRMLDVDAQRRHVILLTDGQSATNPGYAGLTAAMVEHDMTMSTVAVGDGADTALLERLAREARGRYYFTNDQSTLPAIFSRETTLMSRTYIVEQRFVPGVGRAGEWGALFADGVPAVDAYVATTPKETAEQALVSTLGDPLLARWQYGSGRTVAWTSDLTGQWAKDWTGWSRFPDVFAQWVKWTFPQFAGEPYEVAVDWQGGEAKLRIRETSADGGGGGFGSGSGDEAAADLKMVVNGEGGSRSEVSLLPVAPGEYEASVPVAGPGVYLTQFGGATSGFVIPYAAEYRLSDGGGREKLERLAAVTGGRVLDAEAPQAAFAGQKTVTRQHRDIARELLIAVLALWLLDIAIRRLSLPWERWATGVRRLAGGFSRKVVGAGAGAEAGAHAALDRLQQRKKRAGDFYAGGNVAAGDVHKLADPPIKRQQSKEAKVSKQSKQTNKSTGLSSAKTMNRANMAPVSEHVGKNNLHTETNDGGSSARSSTREPSGATRSSPVNSNNTEENSPSNSISKLLEAKRRNRS